jgi:hypothetical protein
MQKRPIVCVPGKGLQHAFPFGVLMVPSSTHAFSADGECLTCGGFFLDETVRLGNFEFITDYFSGLSLSPRRSDSGTTFMGSTRSRPPFPWWVSRGHHRGVPYGFKWRRGLWPVLSQKARCGGSTCSHDNPSMVGGRFGHAVYDDGSIAGTGTMVAH